MCSAVCEAGQNGSSVVSTAVTLQQEGPITPVTFLCGPMDTFGSAGIDYRNRSEQE